MKTLVQFLAAVPHDSLTAIAVKSFVASAILLLLLPLLRNSSAARRHLLLISFFGFLLLLPLASHYSAGRNITISRTVMATRPHPSSTRLELPSPSTVLPEHPPAGRGLTESLPFITILGFAYTVIVLFALASLLGGLRQLRRLRLEGTAIKLPRELDRELSSVMRNTQLVVSSHLIVPATYGLRRPIVLLPEESSRWSREEWRAVLLHELAHIERKDWIVRIVARSVAALYWWNPLVWMALSRLELEAEQASDDSVVRSTDAIESYADQLVSLARRMQSQRGLAAVAMARRGTLRKRVRAILDPDRKRSPLSRSGSIAAVASAAVLVTALAPLQVVRAAAPAGDGVPRSEWIYEGHNSTAERFYRAARRGDLEAIAAFLAQGVDPDTVSEGDGNGLIGAIRGGHPEVVELLLDRGARPDASVWGDGSPLIAAAIAGDLRSARLLVARGANIDLVVPGDENPLINSAREGRMAMVRYLIKAGANVNARVWLEPDQDRPEGEMRTPLFMAVRGKHDEVAEVLRAAGARLEGLPGVLPTANPNNQDD
ncbi:MAG: M56 family metallopeptidase [Acidobacteriota bacterium]